MGSGSFIAEKYIGSLCPVPYFQFLVDILTMLFYGIDGDPLFGSDLFIQVTL